MEKEEKIIFGFILIFIFIGTVGFTYGYFKAEFSYKSDELNVTTGTLKIDYVDNTIFRITDSYNNDMKLIYEVIK